MVRHANGPSATLIVEGKYKVTGRTLPDTLRIASHLVAMERADTAPAAQEGAAAQP